jgi:hypothetical protein
VSTGCVVVSCYFAGTHLLESTNLVQPTPAFATRRNSTMAIEKRQSVMWCARVQEFESVKQKLAERVATTHKRASDVASGKCGKNTKITRLRQKNTGGNCDFDHSMSTCMYGSKMHITSQLYLCCFSLMPIEYDLICPTLT